MSFLNVVVSLQANRLILFQSENVCSERHLMEVYLSFAIWVSLKEKFQVSFTRINIYNIKLLRKNKSEILLVLIRKTVKLSLMNIFLTLLISNVFSVHYPSNLFH